MTHETEWLLPETLFDGRDLHTGLALPVRDGIVGAPLAQGDLPPGAKVARLAGILSPGFVDLQVNGGGDVLFNARPDRDALIAIAAAHRALGTIRILPTVITDAPEVLDAAAEAILAARDVPGLLGLHIEGPHIAEARRGTHAARYLRPMDARTMARVKRLRQAGIRVMITVAAEVVTPDEIAALVDLGCIVSIGHSDGDADTVRGALAAGARCFTHLYNAMSPMLNRAPGVVGAAINSQAHAGIICDGLHVADEMVGLALRARPVPDRMFLISDAMPTVGGRDSFMLYGRKVRLVDGRLINEEGSLAGAHTTMFRAVQRLVGHVGIDLQSALRMATGIPLALISGQPEAQPMLAGLSRDDLVVLTPDLSDFAFLPPQGALVVKQATAAPSA